jgi:hypothetical protein
MFAPARADNKYFHVKHCQNFILFEKVHSLSGTKSKGEFLLLQRSGYFLINNSYEK